MRVLTGLAWGLAVAALGACSSSGSGSGGAGGSNTGGVAGSNTGGSAGSSGGGAAGSSTGGAAGSSTGGAAGSGTGGAAGSSTGGATGCSSNANCAKVDFCQFPDTLCGKGKAGACTTKPQACPDVYAPVCGCDGKTYGNECEANGAGVSKAADGACGTTLGCTSNTQCQKTEFCAFGDGLCGKGAPGACAIKPGACPQVYDPVCGCDGKTYGNACSAASAGMSIVSKGACN